MKKLTKSEWSIVREACRYYQSDATSLDGESVGLKGKKYTDMDSALKKIEDNLFGGKDNE